MAKKRNWKRIILRMAAILLAIVFIVITIFVYRFTKPKTDASIYKKFEGEIHKLYISRIQYKDYSVRVFSTQKELDSTLPILIFVHGSPGSGMNFQRYLADSELNEGSNIITYDRVGYSVIPNKKVLGDLKSEMEVLHQIIPVENTKNVILFGYSYGGTIVAASPKNYKSKILLAPAVKGELEPMFWMMNLYRWKFTRFIIPNVFQNAAKEKIDHLLELPDFENKWTISPSHITTIHGDSDRIVPYGNSLYLKDIFDNRLFQLITIPNGNHGLLWNRFDLIKGEILKEIRK